MLKADFLFLTGLVLGIVPEGLDLFVTEIPPLLCVPFQLLAIGLIFSGFLHKKHHKKEAGPDNMKKADFLFLTGLVLGIILEGLDLFVTEIPPLLCIPFQLLAIGLIFGGFLRKKRHQKDADPDNMKKADFLFLTGLVPGIVPEGPDLFITEIPPLLCIPFQLLAIGLIFSGFLRKKRLRSAASPEKPQWTP